MRINDERIKEIQSFIEREPYKWDDYSLAIFVTQSKKNMADLIEEIQLLRNEMMG